LDPDLVNRRSMPDFEDREEFMLVQNEINTPPGKDGLGPGEEEWHGR